VVIKLSAVAFLLIEFTEEAAGVFAGVAGDGGDGWRGVLEEPLPRDNTDNIAAVTASAAAAIISYTPIGDEALFDTLLPPASSSSRSAATASGSVSSPPSKTFSPPATARSNRNSLPNSV